MSFPYTPRPQDAKIESLRTQYDYLKLLRLRHLQWMSNAENSEAEGAHLQIVGCLEKIMDGYTQLLESLENDVEGTAIPLQTIPEEEPAHAGHGAR